MPLTFSPSPQRPPQNADNCSSGLSATTIRYLAALIVVLLCAHCFQSDAFAQTELPLGAHPKAIPFDHFPDPMHAVVWRNWNLVPTARLAKTLNATEQQINQVAQSMGLGENNPIDERFSKQIYITIVRRNWHLLPYDQILSLTEMTAEELEIGLREDDFLFIKLGRLKPACDPVRYAEPSEQVSLQAAKIKALVEKHRVEVKSESIEPRFDFIDQLSSVPDDFERKPSDDQPRYIYSYFGIFGDPLLDPKVDPYPEGLLARLAEMGVNGVWMHVVLWQLAPYDDAFPEFGKESEIRRENLRRLVENAKKYGISIYLYMNEPRSQPPAFFESRPEMKGVSEAGTFAMCTSDPEVRRWMRDSLAGIFKDVPDLGGVFTITASENLTSCASHGRHAECPRCSKRSAAEIIAEVNATIESGVHQGDPNAKVLTWDWGWNGHRIATDHIELLPQEVWQLSVSEWAKPFERGGIPSQVGEYSMSVVGPGPRAKTHWQAAQQRGIKAAAKVQINNTWELSAVPFIPVMDLVAQHAEQLADENVDGLMLSWSLGGYPSPNLQIAQQLLQNSELTADDVLNQVATERYGSGAREKTRAAWTKLSDAFREFPYDGSTLYNGPQNYGPANLLYLEPTGYRATMLGFPYDDLALWRGHYPADIFVEQTTKLASKWDDGVATWEQAIELVDEDKRDQAIRDINLAKAAGAHFQAMANQSRFVFARNNNELPNRVAIMRECLEEEIRIAKQLYELTLRDSRIGFEASNQYYYTPQDLLEKVLNCETLLEKLEREK